MVPSKVPLCSCWSTREHTPRSSFAPPAGYQLYLFSEPTSWYPVLDVGSLRKIVTLFNLPMGFCLSCWLHIHLGNFKVDRWQCGYVLHQPTLPWDMEKQGLWWHQIVCYVVEVPWPDSLSCVFKNCIVTVAKTFEFGASMASLQFFLSLM